MSEIRVDRIVDSTGNSPVIYLDANASEVRIGTGITFNTVTNQIIVGDTAIGDISGNANFSGIVTAAAFVGDGSGLTNLPSGGGEGASDWVRTGAGIHTLGNVGVGTTNPTTALTINGVLSFDVNSNNIRIGDSNTGANLTTGNDNVFMGVGAGYYNTSGDYNNFIGQYAGYYNTSGDENNFFGLNSGFSNVTGSDNNFIGFSAGYLNTTGCYNIFIAQCAGFYNTTGRFNHFFGCGAGFYNTIGEYNNFFGLNSGFSNTTGCYNNFFGLNSGYSNTTGNNNTFLGNHTGIYADKSYRLIFGGGFSLSSTFDSPKDADTQLAIGIRTSSAPSNYWLVGDENFNIGIGTTNPTTKLQVGGTVTATAFVGDGSGLTNLPSGGGEGTSDFVRTSAGIHTLGNVGVGTTNPTTKLQIGGVLGFDVYDNSSAGAPWNPKLLVGTNILLGDNTTGSSLTPSSTVFGINNIFIGRESGNNATETYLNNFIGLSAGKYTTTGNNNNFLGGQSGYYNTTGRGNAFLGGSSGYYNTTGEFNSFLGSSSGYYNTIGEENVFIGSSAGYYNTIGCYNSFFGNYAGARNQSGSYNLFLGSYTGISTSGSNKIVIGRGNYGEEFDSPDTAKDTQLAIGIRTSSAPADYWLVGDENFNIGIGTTNPTEKLSVGGNIALNQTTLYGSVQASTASTIATGIHSGLSTSVYRSVEYTIQATQGTNYQAIKILTIHDGTTAYDTQYGNIYNNEVATFDVDISGGNVRLVAVASSTSTTNYTVNFIATRI